LLVYYVKTSTSGSYLSPLEGREDQLALKRVQISVLHANVINMSWLSRRF